VYLQLQCSKIAVQIQIILQLLRPKKIPQSTAVTFTAVSKLQSFFVRGGSASSKTMNWAVGEGLNPKQPAYTLFEVQ
jgi:hypothetical protein